MQSTTRRQSLEPEIEQHEMTLGIGPAGFLPRSPTCTLGAMKVVLISPYDIGRQPFGLAEPAALLMQAGFDVECMDLSRQRLDAQCLRGAALVALYLSMHTATRIAVEALPRIRSLAPDAHLCAYGLYAPMNHARLHQLGVTRVLGGECEPALVAFAREVERGAVPVHRHPPEVSLARVPFVVPRREGLPALSRYARLDLPDGSTRTIGFTEASRGCKHRCRHCPVVPVYHGRFRVVPVEVVIEDVANQVAAGAEHISFGDPDFFNGPTHALRIVRAMHARFPALTYDATVKVEHIIAHAGRLPELAATGCRFLTSAVESVDDRILDHLDKGHTRADFERAVACMRDAGISLAPTFVPFTPWTTLEGYVELLEALVALKLVAAVPPVQLAIRLLVPRGSYLFRLEGFSAKLAPFDPALLGYPWRHPDPRVDVLQEAVQGAAEVAEREGWPRRRAFAEIWRLAHLAAGALPPPLPQSLGEAVASHSEPWYCCAEPTARQLADATALSV